MPGTALVQRIYSLYMDGRELPDRKIDLELSARGFREERFGEIAAVRKDDLTENFDIIQLLAKGSFIYGRQRVLFRDVDRRCRYKSVFMVYHKFGEAARTSTIGSALDAIGEGVRNAKIMDQGSIKAHIQRLREDIDDIFIVRKVDQVPGIPGPACLRSD